MKAKEFLFKNTVIARKILSNIPSSYLENKSRKIAFDVYKKALKLDSYSEFLEDNKFDPNISIDQFDTIPVTTKPNYFQKYNFKGLNKDVTPYLYYRSSGYSGQPTYWTQNSDDYKSFLEYMDFNLRYVFSIDKKKTLIVSMFAMSSWVTGQQVLSALSNISSKYKNVTIFACGMVADEPLETIKKFGKDYDQILIFSYPLTFKEFVDKSESYGVNLKELNIYAVIGAEGVTYSWSKFYSKKLSRSNDDEYRILSAYGTADTGIGIASEQRSALVLKDLVYENRKFLKDLTGREDMPLHFFQYNPLENYFEVENEELLITKDKQMPLIRYNLHDEARIIPFTKLIEVAKDHNIDFNNVVNAKGYDLLKLPYFAIYGRTDGTIILNGANIYINSFKEALHQKEVVDFHTGKFRVKKIDEDDMFQNYTVEIELHEQVDSTEELKQLLRKNIIDFLVKNDKGYKSAYHQPYHRDIVCKVEFVSFKDEKTLKHKYQ